jgi:hypothetical protein
MGTNINNSAQFLLYILYTEYMHIKAYGEGTRYVISKEKTSHFWKRQTITNGLNSSREKMKTQKYFPTTPTTKFLLLLVMCAEHDPNTL